MSHIEMKAQKVINAMNKVIALIECERNNRANDIRVKIEKKKKGLFSRDCWQLQDYLKMASHFDSLADDYSVANSYAWKDYEDATMLLALAKHGDPVIITHEHIRLFE
jgi:hypothetical protein